MTRRFAVASVATLVALAQAPTRASPIRVGDVAPDAPTLHTLGVALPIVGGDTSYTTRVLVSYRPQGTDAWKPALPLLRVRPETLSAEDPSPFPVGAQFAGSIFDLDAETAYEVRLDVRDPEGGDTTRTVTIRTRAEPKSEPTAPRIVAVSSVVELSDALGAAAPGDVIRLANGTYDGSFTISRSGTEANPIFVRGENRDGVVVDAHGASNGLTIDGAWITVENLTVRSATTAVRIIGPSDVVIRHLRATHVSNGIDARIGSQRRHYVCDNVLEGREVVWPRTDSGVWDFEGIVVTGEGHVVCHNTISGFGDALGLSRSTSIPNRAVDFYGNDVLWAGDNGIELDTAERNVRAFRNRFTNAGNHAVSFQPIWGGPAYAVRNVIFNTAAAPYKLNNDPSGFYILHNTAIRSGTAWTQLGGRAANFVVENNITVGTRGPVDMTTSLALATIDWNGWTPDGPFQFATKWSSFAALRSSSPYEAHGRLLTAPIFGAPMATPSTHDQLAAPPDVALHLRSNAVDAGVVLPNINDGFTGGAPDLGALEQETPAPLYGVRPSL